MGQGKSRASGGLFCTSQRLVFAFSGGERRSLCGSIQRSELPACPKQPVLNGVGGEGGPCVRDEKLLLRQVVHDDRNAQHGGKRDKIRTDMAIAEGGVVGAPSRHDGIHIPKRPLAGHSRNKPGGGPGGIGAIQQNSIHSRGQNDRTALGKLQGRADAVDDVQPRHGNRHDSLRGELGGEAAASEGPQGSRRPACCLQARGDIGCCQLPPRLHHAVALLVPLRARCVKSRRARIDQVDKSPCRLSRRHLTRHPLDGVRTPIGANIGKNGRTLRQQVFKQHDGGVAGVVFGSQDERRPFETDMHTRIYQQHPEVRCIIRSIPWLLP